MLTDRVRAAHGDVWQAQGRLRATLGGGAAEWPGIRLMASGIAVPQWNNADVTDPAAVDIDAVRSWYAERGVPWGVRVPAGMSWPHGRLLFTKRNMGVLARDVRLLPEAAGLAVTEVGPADLDDFVRVDATAFAEDDPGPTREWTRPLVGAPGFRLLLARLDGLPAGVVCGVRTSGLAGESVGVLGLGVLASARRRGLGTALVSHALRWGLDTGADLAWLNPDTDGAAALYARLGFEETGGFDVYVDN